MQLQLRGELECVNSLFEQPWWLDAVAPGRWSAITVEAAGGRVQARLPFVLERRLGMVLATQPRFTQTLGPWIESGEGAPGKQLSAQLELMEMLLGKLPKLDYHAQSLHRDVRCALPFHWSGYRCEIRYTHLLRDLQRSSDLSFYRSSVRREVRKAQRQLVVRDDLGLERFMAVNELTFRRQGMRLPYEPATLRRLHQACEQRGTGRLLFAEDSQSRVHAAIFVVWDHRATYYLLGGADPELRTSGAHSLLMWEAIQAAAKVSEVFDFEGSMNQAIGRFFRGFNAEVVPFCAVWKASRRGRLLDAAIVVRRVLRR